MVELVEPSFTMCVFGNVFLDVHPAWIGNVSGSAASVTNYSHDLRLFVTLTTAASVRPHSACLTLLIILLPCF